MTISEWMTLISELIPNVLNPSLVPTPKLSKEGEKIRIRALDNFFRSTHFSYQARQKTNLSQISMLFDSLSAKYPDFRISALSSEAHIDVTRLPIRFSTTRTAMT